SPHLTDQARQAIAHAIEELDYRPSAIARSIKAQRTYSVGVLVNDLRQPWFVEFLQGLGDALHRHGLYPLVADGRLDRRTDERLVNSFMDMRVDGLVLAGTMEASDAIVKAAGRIPTVLSGSRLFPSPTADLVAQDDTLVTRTALEHLRALGHDRITYVGGDSGVVFTLRGQAYSDMMKALGLTDHTELCDSTEEGGYRTGLQILDRPPEERPTAIYAASDLIALGIMSAAAELGQRIPDDISIVGVDNTHLAKMRSIQLTSVDILPYEQGRLSGETLNARITAPQRPATQQLIEPVIRVRRSTGQRRTT
ncbi:MAG: LacI family DNA-binding transcriptional regulator, partial [Janthinobacterium lividum]